MEASWTSSATPIPPTKPRSTGSSDHGSGTSRTPHPVLVESRPGPARDGHFAPRTESIAASYLNQPLERADLRPELELAGFPQLVLRWGRPG